MVILDTPIQLFVSTITVAAWAQHDMSAGAGAIAATDGAVKAILRAEQSITQTDSGSALATIAVQNNGLGGAVDGTNIVSQARVSDETGGQSSYATEVNDFTVNLDSNSDFEYAISAAGTSYAGRIILVGYYV